MDSLKGLEGKKVRVFEATYNHSSFAAPICIAGQCTFVDIENGWIMLDEDKIFNVKFLNRIEIVDESKSKRAKKKEKERQKKIEKKEKRAARKSHRKALFRKEKVETVIEDSAKKPDSEEDKVVDKTEEE